MRVLVIEDSPEQRDLLRVGLEAAGHEVLTASHGQEALAYLNGHPVDVVVTDLFMPEMDGIEVISTLKRQYPRIRVLAISGRTGVDYLKVAKELGAARILRKPFPMDELIAAVEDLPSQ
jgi:DNA-binding response OmpR family regulator